MTTKSTSITKEILIQDVLDEFLAAESLTHTDIAEIQSDASYVVLLTEPVSPDSTVTTYKISRLEFISEFLLSIVPGVTRESMRKTEKHESDPTKMIVEVNFEQNEVI